jgi:hypothetical protein
MDNYMDFRTGSPENPDPKHDPARKAMGFARWLSERVDLASLTPQSDLTSTGYCLANPGVEYLAYRPQSDSKEFSAKLESGRYAVEWTDLTSGRVVKAKDLQVRGDAVVKAKDLQVGEYRFVPPVKNPSILHLKK